MDKVYEDRIAFLESKVSELEEKIKKLDKELVDKVINEIDKKLKF